MTQSITRKPTHDEQLLSSTPSAADSFIHTDTWRIFRIMGEFVEGFEALTNLGPAVTIFGSARTDRENKRKGKLPPPISTLCL